MNSALKHSLSIVEVADLTGHRPETIRKLAALGRCPTYLWRENWKQPRWEELSIGEWVRTLASIDVNALPERCPPLRRPADVFRDSRQGPTSEELATAARMCGVKCHQNEKTPPMGVSPSISCKQLLHLDGK